MHVKKLYQDINYRIRVLFPIFKINFNINTVDDTDSSGTDYWCEIYTKLKIQNYQYSYFERPAKYSYFYISKISYTSLPIPVKESFGIQILWFRKFERTKINLDSQKYEIFSWLKKKMLRMNSWLSNNIKEYMILSFSYKNSFYYFILLKF